MHSFVVALLLLSVTNSTHGLNILVWTSTIGLSHTNFLGSIADTLKEDGHNVTLLLVEFDPDFTSETGTKLVEHIIRYSSPYHDPADWYTLTFKKDQVFNVVLGLNVRDFARMQIFAYNICRGILEDSLLLRQLRESRFDLGIFEMMHSCPAGVMELVGIPKTMLVSAIGMGYHHYRLLGMEKPASFVPATFTIYGSRMTFIGRLHNIAFNALGWMFANICEYSEQSLFDSMFPGLPRLHNLIQDKTDYFLMNTNEFTESTRPTLLSIGHVGGSSISTPRPLSDEFERIVSKGSRGVILFSLGSLVKSSDMPVTVRRAFTEAFQLFPEYVILWKSDIVRNSTYSNIFYQDWIPQMDLLADGRVKLFITHAGMNSIQEAIHFGVPMVTVPLFADQYTNAAVAAERGFAVTLDKRSLSKDGIVKAINTVLGTHGESAYAQRVRQAARLLKGSPEEMRRKIKRFARISGSEPPLNHLKLDIGHLNNFQYYNIDIYLFLCVMFSFSIFAFYHSIVLVYRFIFPLKKRKCD